MRDGEVEFEVIFLTKANKLIVCGSAMPEADDERDTLVSMLRLVAVAHGAVAACVIAEFWFDPARRDGRRPSESPSRREALSVRVMYRHDDAIFLLQSNREIIRDASGKIVALLPPSAPPTAKRCDKSQGRLMRIMPREQPSRHERRLAKAIVDKLPVHRTVDWNGMTLH